MHSLFTIDGFGKSLEKPHEPNIRNKVHDIGEEFEEILDDLFLDLFEELDLNLIENPNLK